MRNFKRGDLFIYPNPSDENVIWQRLETEHWVRMVPVFGMASLRTDEEMDSLLTRHEGKADRGVWIRAGRSI